MDIRLLNANEIDVRVATINSSGASLLLYKDARVDMAILDEVYGSEYWEREHQLIGDRLYCTISVWNKEIGQWVSKQDVGTESYTEKEKGQASDSFKRAGFNIGIGRELYTGPRIWVTDIKIEYKNGRYVTYDRFEVKEIEYNSNREISKLTIVNEDTKKVVFTFPDKVIKDEVMKEKVNEKDIAALKSLATKKGQNISQSKIANLTFEKWKQNMDYYNSLPDKE